MVRPPGQRSILKSELSPLPIGGGLMYALNVVHFFQQKYVPRGCVHPVGHACATTLSRPVGACEVSPPPSVAAAISALTLPVGFSVSLPFVTTGARDAVSCVAAAVAGSVRGVHPPAAIPVSGARWDDVNLRYNRPGVPLCSSGCECAGAQLDGAPGPLPVYLSESEAATGSYPTDGYCLLCIRCDAESLDSVMSAVVESSPSLGSAAVCGAPFQNLVNCADG
jgi:hypothetical protein